MKIYLTTDEIEELEETGMIEDYCMYIDDGCFGYPLNTLITKANKQGYPFSRAIHRSIVVEAMLNGGVLIRPYDVSIDYPLDNIDISE